MIKTEDREQIEFISWFRKNYKPMIIHIPNGGRRSITEACKFKAMGVVKGVPDLFIPEWKVWLEMKRTKNGRVSPEQSRVIEDLLRCGYSVAVCYGAEQAKEYIKTLQFVTQLFESP